MAKKKMIHEFYEMKRNSEKITFLTAYDYPTAQFAETAGLDMLLVGENHKSKSTGDCSHDTPQRSH